MPTVMPPLDANRESRKTTSLWFFEATARGGAANSSRYINRLRGCRVGAWMPMLALGLPPTAHRGEGAAPTGGGNTIILSTRCV